ncbi:hypothetical protein MKJ04_09090 [Pontibacter sp. E15-1]|uniref:hypothetical protein n=1 Tax=Pontibacter sp. E15-1 TaxID=2919918 RepID=UPI001F502A29|nr:hypothetical protein [Pontibacter sp. E15-1]MCJ8164999.1 hypothetical protein [Pontibacter sp. E15-1]
MENNTSQNQSNDKSKNTNSSSQGTQQNKGAQAGSVMAMFQPHDMSRTVESALHVFQGNHDKLPELMQDVGHIILKATRRFTTTQLILTAGALTVGAILLSRYRAAHDEYEEA